MTTSWLRGWTQRLDRDRRLALGILVASAVLAGAVAFIWDATLTHDEVVYVDIASHLLSSDYYPGDLFLRHPPLGLGLLSVWQAAELPLRAWPLPWGLAGIALTGAALRVRDGTMAALAPIVASPALLPMTSVTIYPPLFAFLGLAAWGWASGRRGAEVIGWNLAVLTHELALLVLAFSLAPRAIGYLGDRETDPRRWASLVVPYPAAVAWGLVMIGGLFQGSDPRGGLLSALWDPTPNALAVWKLKPVIGLVFLATLAPIMRWPRDPRDPARGLTAAAVLAIVVVPFYRYLLALVPILAVVAAADPPGWTDERRWPTVLVLTAMLATGGALALTTQGVDTLNAGGVPGLVDHEAGASLLGEDETVIVRSPVSFAHVLRDDGWRLASTGEVAPSEIQLVSGNRSITLLRAETLAKMRTLSDERPVDAVLVPSSWEGVISSLQGTGWTPTDQAGGLTRLSAP